MGEGDSQISHSPFHPRQAGVGGFCYIEKVACKQFNILFWRITNHPDATKAHWRENTPQKHGLNKGDLERLLMNKTWHKAVFYREPLERFLSGYLSKCGLRDQNGKRHCLNEFSKMPDNFSDAVRLMGDPGHLHGKKISNEHFLDQASFCGGLKDSLQFYDTVEQLDRDSSNRKVTELLAKVNITLDVSTLFPKPGDIGPDRHNSDAHDNLGRYFGDVDSLALRRLRDHYKMDYELFGMATPDWAEALIQNRSVTGGRI